MLDNDTNIDCSRVLYKDDFKPPPYPPTYKESYASRPGQSCKSSILYIVDKYPKQWFLNIIDNNLTI